MLSTSINNLLFYGVVSLTKILPQKVSILSEYSVGVFVV